MPCENNYYYKDGQRRNRNANIEDYLEGLRSITSRGNYVVIIIGDPNSLEEEIDGRIKNIPNMKFDEKRHKEQ